MHSEGILAGELKHGPLALVDKQMPVIMVIMKDPCFAKCQNALQQVTARQVRDLLGTELSALLFRTTHAHLTHYHHSCLWVYIRSVLSPFFYIYLLHVRAMADVSKTEGSLPELLILLLSCGLLGWSASLQAYGRRHTCLISHLAHWALFEYHANLIGN